MSERSLVPLQWRHNDRHGISNNLHSSRGLFNRLIKLTSKKTSKPPLRPLLSGIHRWLLAPLTKGQWRGKRFHWMTSTCRSCLCFNFDDKIYTCHQIFLAHFNVIWFNAEKLLLHIYSLSQKASNGMLFFVVGLNKLWRNIRVAGDFIT